MGKRTGRLAISLAEFLMEEAQTVGSFQQILQYLEKSERITRDFWAVLKKCRNNFNVYFYELKQNTSFIVTSYWEWKTIIKWLEIFTIVFVPAIITTVKIIIFAAVILNDNACIENRVGDSWTKQMILKIKTIFIL